MTLPLRSSLFTISTCSSFASLTRRISLIAKGSANMWPSPEKAEDPPWFPEIPAVVQVASASPVICDNEEGKHGCLSISSSILSTAFAIPEVLALKTRTGSLQIRG